MASPLPLPTVAIIAGAWQNPEHYVPLQDAFAKLSYESVCQAPSSTCPPHGDTDLAADIAFVSTGLLSLVDPVSLLFHKLTLSETQYWACKIERQAPKPLQGIVSYAPFEDNFYMGHLAYLRCAEDECVHPPGQAKFIAAAGNEETDELPTSHLPWLEMADMTAKRILDLVAKVRM
ncbi:hypothetical protein BJX65DRAFT_304021 [Aspergillus insuetus]